MKFQANNNKGYTLGIEENSHVEKCQGKLHKVVMLSANQIKNYAHLF